MPGSSTHPTILNPDAAVPEWFAAARRRGRAAWSSASMPARGSEEWKYAEIDFTLDEFRPAGAPTGRMGMDQYVESLDGVSGRATLVDGALVDAEGDVVWVGGVLDAQSERVAGRFRTATSPGIDIFSSANHAFAPPGVVVVIPDGAAISAPVVIDVQSVTDGAVSYPHLTVLAGPGSEGSVVVLYRSEPGAELLVSPILDVMASRNARVAVSVVQHLSGAARMVAHHNYVAGRDATVRIDEVGLGGRHARQRLGVSLAGLGSSVKMGGIYFGDGTRLLDYRIYVTHRGPRSTSDIFLKGAVADQSRAVWTGLMRIENQAVGTSAFETNRNLVLSKGALVHSVPNLEILTDDLQCGHGSSSGPLDEEQLYYMMSRGLARNPAERLLVRGFFDEILGKLAVPHLAEPSRAAVAAKFAAAQARAAS